MLVMTDLRTPYTTHRAKTQEAKSRLRPGRLTKAELAELLEDDDDQD
jgi:hypothetical protein